MTERAYTFVDHAKAMVGNAWLERTWSGLIGNTRELLDKTSGFDWISGQSKEFDLTVGDETLSTMDFGEKEWSEENSPTGATLVSQHSRPGLELCIRTLAFHEHPAVARTTTISNTSDESVTIGPLSTEYLPLRHEGLEVYTDKFSRKQVAAEWGAEEQGAAVVLKDHGIILGQQGGGVYQLNSPVQGVCAVQVTERRDLGPGQSWQLPVSFLIPFTGELMEAVETHYAGFLLRCLAQVNPDTARS